MTRDIQQYTHLALWTSTIEIANRPTESTSNSFNFLFLFVFSLPFLFPFFSFNYILLLLKRLHCIFLHSIFTLCKNNKADMREYRRKHRTAYHSSAEHHQPEQWRFLSGTESAANYQEFKQCHHCHQNKRILLQFQSISDARWWKTQNVRAAAQTMLWLLFSFVINRITAYINIDWCSCPYLRTMQCNA